MFVFILISGFLVGIFSGMLGIGGGILITPILLYIPNMLGLPSLSMKSITGLTMVQGLVGSASGYLAHKRYNIVNKQLIYWMGPSIIVSSFIGARLSSLINDEILMVVFAILALAASLLILVNKKEESHSEKAKNDFNRPIAISIAMVVGFTGGLVGQGGSFLLVPALINILNIPTRVALGSNLGIVLLSSIAGLSGKISVGLVEPSTALALIIGVIPGAQIGGYLSHRINKNVLKKILAIVIVLTSLRIWWTVLEAEITSFVTNIPANPFLYISVFALILGIVTVSLFIKLYRKYRGQNQKENSNASE